MSNGGLSPVKPGSTQTTENLPTIKKGLKSGIETLEKAGKITPEQADALRLTVEEQADKPRLAIVDQLPDVATAKTFRTDFQTLAKNLSTGEATGKDVDALIAKWQETLGIK